MSDPVPHLRRAGAADAGAIAALHTASWQAAYAHLLPVDYLLGELPALQARHWQTYLGRDARDQGLVMLAEHDGVPVGFVSAERPTDAALGVLLDSLHVHPAHHGRGAGTRLIDAVRDWARELGAARVHLFVLEGNARAIRFYERSGWTQAGSASSQIGRTPVTDRIYVMPT
ncbi:GNAT family N-acetyltransferase [Burkholderia perseverans]|uniref:GNAT family N-acetyltransferase n=1 Tax=Burkholderia perseverans TaxID=2615214 RepID=UPI001FEF3741|nr:GNAT family N-acetyltransferase [Burkholderia perseverans]